MKKWSEMTKQERIKEIVRSGTRTSKILNKIHRENKDVVTFDRPKDGRSLIAKQHTLDARIREEVSQPTGSTVVPSFVANQALTRSERDDTPYAESTGEFQSRVKSKFASLAKIVCAQCLLPLVHCECPLP
jgi:hypothetical protein